MPDEKPGRLPNVPHSGLPVYRGNLSISFLRPPVGVRSDPPPQQTGIGVRRIQVSVYTNRPSRGSQGATFPRIHRPRATAVSPWTLIVSWLRWFETKYFGAFRGQL